MSCLLLSKLLYKKGRGVEPCLQRLPPYTIFELNKLIYVPQVLSCRKLTCLLT